LVKQIALKIVSAALAADKQTSASSFTPASPNAAAPSALLHASSGQLRNLLRELQRLKRSPAAKPQLSPDQQLPQQPQQLVQDSPTPEAHLLLPMHSPHCLLPPVHAQLSRVQDQQLLSAQAAHGKLCWRADSLPGFAVSAFDTETDAYLIPVSHIGKLTQLDDLASKSSMQAKLALAPCTGVMHAACR
jgi:hypothetical protein